MVEKFTIRRYILMKWPPSCNLLLYNVVLLLVLIIYSTTCSPHKKIATTIKQQLITNQQRKQKPSKRTYHKASKITTKHTHQTNKKKIKQGFNNQCVLVAYSRDRQ